MHLPVEDDGDEGLNDGEEGVHDPVDQPLLVVLLVGALDSLEGVVRGEEEANHVAVCMDVWA